MGKILIIRNNNRESKIYTHAKASYEEKKIGFYNTCDGSSNENYLKKIKDDFGEKGIVLFISYDGQNTDVIEDIFIGSQVEINEKNNVKYFMKVYLEKENHKRVIESIIDKIDLDINKDFDNDCYIIMSDMDSLYQELRERIIVRDEENVEVVPIEELEQKDYKLDKLAQKDSQSVRVYGNSNISQFRTEFQRDRERIVNCKAFRRLVDKAQIFSTDKGDYYRTRMTHSLEVNQIAKAISYALHLNLDLTEAIALGHDLGHTPFGHQGERTLDDILCGNQKVGIVVDINDELLKERCFGRFKHNYQSARVLTVLEEKYNEYPGLNVSIQVVEGVLKHTKLKATERELEDFLDIKYLEKINIKYGEELQVCSSLEGQVVAIADEIAQRGHDVDDALTSGVMTIDEFIDRLKISKCRELEEVIKKERKEIDNSKRLIIDKEELKIARIVSSIVHYFIETTIEHSRNRMKEYALLEKIGLENDKKIIEFSPDVDKVNAYLERVVQKKVICNTEVARADYNASMVVKDLFEKYYKNPRLLHSGTLHKIFIEMLRHPNKMVANSAINMNDGSIKLVNKEIYDITQEPIDKNIILDYIKNKTNERDEKDIIIFEKRKILVRAITDYIAGMTDGYALEEYERLR